MPTLDQIPVGGRCRIEALGGPPPLVQRLLEFGLMEGEEVTVVALAPFGDPIEVESPLTRLSLRRAEAAHITVAVPG
ncbi:MAG TPA: FeoA family protein [Gemmataceae bacterium]|jgi:ferrous iron transport protein A|nr:FeoA family protein [Gemmataceae bacterium]